MNDLSIPSGSALTTSERSRLDELETVIRRGLQSFVEAGEAMTEVRESRLYRETHATFEDYCRERWSVTPQHAGRLIAASRVMEAIEPIGSTDGALLPPPATESQARELAPLLDEPEKLRAAWAEANRATGGKPTAAAVRHAREQVSPRPVPVPPVRPTLTPPPAQPLAAVVDEDVVEAEIVDEPMAAAGQTLVDALERHMPGTQADLDRSGIRSRWSKNIHAIADIPLMDPELVAMVLRDIDISAYRLTVRQLSAWCERLDNILEPKGLRAIEGGRS